MDGSQKNSPPAKQFVRQWLCRVLGIALIPAAVTETGCSAPSMAWKRQNDFDVELVAMPARKSLLGDGFLSRRKTSLPQQSIGNGNPGGGATVTPESEERLLAIARLFTAQGRTQDAQRIYQKLGRTPEQQSAGTIANRSEQPKEQPAATAPAGTSTPTVGSEAKQASRTTAEHYVKPPRSVAENDSTTDKPSDKQASESKQAPQQPPPTVTAATPSSTAVSSAAPAELPLNSTVTTSVSTAVDTPGWQNSGESSSLPPGPEYTISTGISGLPRPWSPPDEPRRLVESSPVLEISPPAEGFKTPILPSQSSEWDATLNVAPGKFQTPTIHPGRPSSGRAVREPSESFAAPDRAPLPSPSSTSEVQPVRSDDLDEAEDSTSNDVSDSSLLIIPNGAGAAEKIARIRKRTNQPQAVVDNKDASKSPTNGADVLLTGPYRDMHSPQVLEAAKLLDDDDPKRRADGARKIGLAGAEARTVLPVLHDRLSKEKHKLVQARIAEAILKIVPGDAEAIRKLTELLGDPADWKTRQAAAAGLTSTTNGTSTEAISKLVQALNDSHPRVRAMVALTLGAFGPKAKEALPRLQFAATTDIPRVQEAAQAAIACISPDAKSNPAAATQTGGEVGADKESENHQPALLPAGEEHQEATVDSDAWVQDGNDERNSKEDDGDPFSGTLFDFDAPAVKSSK